MNNIVKRPCSNGCHRMQNGKYSTCCKACGTGVHTADCNSRNRLCANNCGRTKYSSYQHCCPDCATGGHTSKCDNRNRIQPSQHNIQPVKVAVPATKPIAQNPYLIVDSQYGPKSAHVTLHGCNYGNTTRKPHVNFNGNFPNWGTKYFLGPAKVGGIRNEAIMRDLLDSQTNKPTKYHVTVYHESAGQGTASSLLLYYSN